MKAGDVTVTSNGAAGEANGVRMEANFNSTIDEDGNRVRKQGEVNVETGDITAKAETGNAVGAYSYAYGSIVNAETGSVTARGNGDVTGVSVQASDLIGSTTICSEWMAKQPRTWTAILLPPAHMGRQQLS